MNFNYVPKELTWAIICIIIQIDKSSLASDEDLPGKILKNFKVGEASINVVEDKHDAQWSPPVKRKSSWYLDHDNPHNEHQNHEIFEDDLDKIDFGTSQVITFKLSDLLKKFAEMSGQDKLGQLPKSIMDKLIEFLTTSENGESIMDQKISLRSIRRLLKLKFNRLISTGCLGDLLYLVDSIFEYSLARNDMSDVCWRPLDGKVNCSCTDKVQATLDENAWSLDVLDSFGKFPSGLIKGNYWFLGDFEQCTGINAQKSSAKQIWQGRYSRVDFFLYKDMKWTAFLENDKRGMFSDIETGLNVVQLPSSLPECNVFFQVKYGACFPQTCSKHDLETIIEYVVNIPQRLAGKRVVCAADVVYHDAPSIFDDSAALFVAFMVIIVIALAILGTIYDCQVHSSVEPLTVHNENNHTELQNSKSKSENAAQKSSHPLLLEILLAFSIKRNAKKIFDMSSESTKDHVKCMHGIRALSMLWVLWAHSYSAGTLFVDNAFDVLAITNNIFNQLMLNATLSVDAFFLMGGTLLAFMWLKRMKQTNAKHLYDWKTWIQFYVHRYIRLTPVYAFVLLIQIFLVRYATDGPLWNPGGFEPSVCRTGWWTNIAYINNIISLNRICMVWSWYLANDMQFFFFSPPLLILLWVSGVAGMAVIVLLIVVTSIIRGAVIMSNDAFPPINIIYNDLAKLQSVEEFTAKVYISPHCRCGPYLVGLLLGYVLFKYRKSIKLSKATNVLIWLVSSALGLWILFGIYHFCKTGEISNVYKAIYGSSCRVLWTVFLAWIVLAGSTGHGGKINQFLSSRRWKPISRLVYCAYLIHPIIMLLYYSSFMKPIHYEGHYQITNYFFCHVILTFFFAFWLSCLVEMPVANLERSLMIEKRAKKFEQPSVEHNKPVRNATAQKLLSFEKDPEVSNNNAASPHKRTVYL